MKKLFILFAVVILIMAFFLRQNNSGPIKSIKIGNTIINNLEIADTQDKQEQGLSGRTSIEENYGMLFVFDTPGYWAFWMKNMNFPIDMIWFDENGKVVGLEESALPSSYPKSFAPQSPAKYVLEVNAGIAQKEGLKTGSFLIISR